MHVRQITPLIITWTLIGFPLLASICAIFGVTPTVYSAVIRAIIVALSVAILVGLVKRKLRPSIFFSIYIIFWLTYITRLLISSLSSEELSHPSWHYWIWAIGSCLLPSLVLSVKNCINFPTLYRAIMAIGLITSVIILSSASTTVISASGDEIDVGRLQLESLNPITVGHLAATVALLSISGLLNKEKRLPTAFLHAFCIMISGALLIQSGSRGPLVAFVITVLLLILPSRKVSTTQIFLFALLMLIVLSQIFSGVGTSSIQGVSRLVLALEGNDASGSLRLMAATGAIQQFLSNPWFGSGLEESTTGFYPHNLILEAFMATGLLGGVSFLYIFVASSITAVSVARSREQTSWIGAVTFQYCIAALFSGAIYNAAAFWTMIVVSQHLLRQNNTSASDPR